MTLSTEANWLVQLRQLRANLTTSRSHLDRMICQFAGTVPADVMVLDAGAGDSPYRKHFAHTRYSAADVCLRIEAHRFSDVSYVCDLVSIPVTDACYDVVLCTQVLEHVPRPLDVLREFYRVLKPGGRLWLSAPLSFPEHEIPYDFFRYTQFGLRFLFEQADFQIHELGWVSGYLGTLAHQMNTARHELPRRARDYGGGLPGALALALSSIVRPLCLILAFVYSRLDLRHRYTAGGHCMDYYVIAGKPPH
jgi:SAM-dependent methyltransferase